MISHEGTPGNWTPTSVNFFQDKTGKVTVEQISTALDGIVSWWRGGTPIWADLGGRREPSHGGQNRVKTCSKLELQAMELEHPALKNTTAVD